MTDRLLPHSLEAEQGVLGCILLSPVESLSEIQSAGVTPDAFYDLRHKRLAEVLFAMHENADWIDTITLRQKLTDLNELNAVGGLAYVSSLPNEVPSAANLNYYLEILIEKYERRLLQQTCLSLERDILTGAETAGLIDRAEREILGIRRSMSGNVRPIKQLVQSAIDRLEAYCNRKGLIGLPTGFLDLDRQTAGLENGTMIVLAARPSLGKTSLGMNIAENLSLGHGQSVGVFSLEMSAESLITRIISSRARVNIRQAPDWTEAQKAAVMSACGSISKAAIWIDDTSGLSVQTLRARARRMHQKFNCALYIVDYIQLLHSTARRFENRQTEMTSISGQIKEMAKELDRPVIALAQLSRDCEKERRKPMVADLRESGAIEQDADIIGLLYRDTEREKEKQSDYGPDRLPINLLIAKQRNGPTGDVQLIFRRDITRFENYSNL